MKKYDSELNKIIMRAAGEESSIYDTICELRSNLIKGNSLQDYVNSIFESIDLIEKYRIEGKVGVYKHEEDIIDSFTKDIYNTYLYIP